MKSTEEIRKHLGTVLYILEGMDDGYLEQECPDLELEVLQHLVTPAYNIVNRRLYGKGQR